MLLPAGTLRVEVAPSGSVPTTVVPPFKRFSVTEAAPPRFTVALPEVLRAMGVQLDRSDEASTL